MSNLETRVARAVYDAWVLRSGWPTKWDDLAQEERDNFADDARAAIAACGVEELRAEVAAYKEGERLAMERMRVGGAERDATIARLAAGVADLVAALTVSRANLANLAKMHPIRQLGENVAKIDAALKKAKGETK